MSFSSHPPQPPQSATYIQPANPTSSNPSEAAQSQQSHADSPSLLNDSTTTKEPITRTVGDVDVSRGEAGSDEGRGIPTALARGVRGSEADREREVEEVLFCFFSNFLSFSLFLLPSRSSFKFATPLSIPILNRKQTTHLTPYSLLRSPQN